MSEEVRMAGRSSRNVGAAVLVTVAAVGWSRIRAGGVEGEAGPTVEVRGVYGGVPTQILDRGRSLSDYGINDAFMKELAGNIKPGDAALFVLIRHMTADKVLREIQDAGGTVLKTSLDDAKEKLLRDALAKAGQSEQPGPAGAG